MNTYVAPLYCQTNPISQEKLAIGLILFAAEPNDTPTIFFKLSEKKLQVAEKLTNVSKSFFAATEKYIQNAVQDLKSQPPLMAQFTKKPTLLDEKVYEHLHQYAHGLLEFGALKPFSGPVNQASFEKLFADFTGDTLAFIPAEPKKKTLAAMLKKHLVVPQLQEKADICYSFTPKQLPGILKKTTAEAIAVNGQVKSLHGVDFMREKTTISHHLNELEVYYYALKDFVKGTSTLEKLTIAFNRPPAKSDKERLLNVANEQKSSIFELITIDEIEDFTRSVSSNAYQKFSEVFERVGE